MHRRTPCVGICSTTFGDLVCRGCKRFAHEIVDWNAYSMEQRDRVEERLSTLLQGSVQRWVRVTDAHALAATATELRLRRAQSAPPELVALAVLRRLHSLGSADDCGQHGIAPVREAHAIEELVQAIDQEFLRRSQAFYEHSFKLLAR